MKRLIGKREEPSINKTVSLKGMKRSELDEIALKLGLDPQIFSTKAEISEAIEGIWRHHKK